MHSEIESDTWVQLLLANRSETLLIKRTFVSFGHSLPVLRPKLIVGRHCQSAKALKHRHYYDYVLARTVF